MAEWPEHSAELARKSLEQMNEAVFKAEQGRLSQAAVWLIADTITSITQGLIPADDWETIYAIREELGVQLGKKK